MEQDPSEDSIEDNNVEVNVPSSSTCKIFASLKGNDMNKELYVVFLVDGSRSISDTNFNNIVDCIREVVKKIDTMRKSRNSYSLFQFSSKITSYGSVPVGRTQIYKNLKLMIREKDNANETNLSLALNHVANYIKDTALPVSDCDRIVFLFTDGILGASKDCTTEARKVKEQATLICVGIGNLVNFELQKWATTGRVINAGSAEVLVKEIEKIGLIEMHQFDIHKLIIEAYPTSGCKSCQDLSLMLTLTNQGEKEITKFSLIFRGDNKYFAFQKIDFPAIGPSKKVQKEITLKCLQAANPEDFPFSIIFIVRQKNQDVTTLECILGTEYLRGDYGDKPINVLVFGPMGCGKSSFINCVYTCLSNDRRVRNGPKVEKSAHHVTTEYSIYHMDQLLKLDTTKFPFLFFDIWGSLVSSNSTPFETVGISHFLDGKIPLSTKLESLSELPLDDLKVNSKLKIDSVVVVITQGSIEENPQATEWQHFRSCLSAIRKEKKITVVVTFMDQITIQDTNEERELKEKAAEFLGIGKSLIPDIFLHQNYTFEKERVPEIDKSTRLILLNVKKNAEETKALDRNHQSTEVVNSMKSNVEVTWISIASKTRKSQKIEIPDVNEPLKSYLPVLLKPFEQLVLHDEKYTWDFVLSKGEIGDQFFGFDEFDDPIVSFRNDSFTFFIEKYENGTKNSEAKELYSNTKIDHQIKFDKEKGWQVTKKLILYDDPNLW